MIRYYCDTCNKELDSILTIKFYNRYGGIEIEAHLCNTCYKEEINKYLKKRCAQMIENKIEVGDYIRTKDGTIAKIIGIYMEKK